MFSKTRVELEYRKNPEEYLKVLSKEFDTNYEDRGHIAEFVLEKAVDPTDKYILMHFEILNKITDISFFESKTENKKKRIANDLLMFDKHLSNIENLYKEFKKSVLYCFMLKYSPDVRDNLLYEKICQN